ncbi:MAG TPA: amino acid adenylation domain-containing protein, partial [Verrucomicrobiae bacterium]|nr:amino acid adenylation domain-containing protein [Verrucomicrobiae bacterium]
ATEEARQPLNLSQSPLLRVRLIRLAADAHLLLITTHHILCDGWSVGILYRELTALYEAFLQRRPSPLPELPSDYADYVRSQRMRLRGDRLQSQLNFWKQRLAGAPTTLDLPTDRPRPPVQTYHGATLHFVWPQRLASLLNALARQEGVTLFMLLLAAFETLLHRYTGQEDMLIGTPIAGRTTVETEPLVGFFLNTLVLRGDVSGDPTFPELLQRVRKTALAAYAHQELPFEKLVDTLQPARDLSRSPLFQVMFILQNEPLQSLELAGLKLTPLRVHSGTAKFDLMLSLEESAGGLGGFIEYNTDLFDAETVARLTGHYQMLLESVVVNAEQRLSQLSLLTEPERKQIFTDWNNSDTEFPRDKCIHQLFEDQAGRTPDAVALAFADDTLTYRELNERANQLAGELQKLGVGPDVRVGICVRRSLEMVVGLLGILKAGGCYVPLDPEYPKERLTFMLRDAQAPVLVTRTALHGHFKSEVSNLKLLFLDKILESKVRPNDEGQPASRFTLHTPMLTSGLRPATSGNLAYVIYTSGSTGTPKGVMVTHRNVVNFFTGMDRVLGTKPGVWLAVTSISFDISVLELFWTLARGFKVVIQPDDDRGNGAPADGQWRSLPEHILRHGVTHLQCTPSLAGTFLLAPESQAAVRSLDKLLLGGEALPVSLAKQLHEILRGELLNLYGPTETAVWSAAHRVEKVENPIPIGRPIANTQVYVLDKNLQPVPAGVPGEIFIGGEGVTRGYLNRPELTAEKFIRNPFSTEARATLYRTGDLGRWRENGTIEFLGRLDLQVKIRGHRIESGEIESVLARHPAVREAVVVAREDSPGDKRLAAYVVAASAAKPAATELRRFAREKLPEAMVPSVFVFLDRLPLTPNGKVNRRLLPAPETARPELETAYAAPRSGAENSIAQIWRELLRVERVG